MPINNVSGAFNVGRDCTLVLMGPFGRVDLPNVTGFDAKQETAAIKVDRLDGVQLNAEVPKGWTGSFEMERGSSAVDDLIADIETGWMTNGSYANSTIYQYIKEADGSTSTYQFTDASLKLSDAGSWKGDASVKQRLDFMAGRRQRV